MGDITTLGFVGCGDMSQMAHIRNYAEIPGVRLKALTDLKIDQAQRVAARYDIEHIFPDVDAICADPDIDGVACIMFWAVQVEPAIRLLEAGKHVIVEKPLAGSAAEGKRMVDAARAAGRHLVCGYMKCHDSGIQWARSRIKERGAVNQVHLFFSGGDWWADLGNPIKTDEAAPSIWGTADWMPAGLSEAQQLAFGFCINIYTHHLGLFRYLLDTELHLKHMEIHAPSETIIFSAANTQVVLMRSHMACQWWEECVRLVFDDVYIGIEPPPPMACNIPARVKEYVKGDGMGTVTMPVTGWNWTFKRQAEHFVEVCAGKATPLVPGEHAWRDLLLMEVIARHYPPT